MKKIALTQGDYVEVVWEDATSAAGTWCSPDFKGSLIKMTTRGFFVEGDKKKISVSHSQAEDNAYFAPLSIPVGWVISIKKLKGK